MGAGLREEREGPVMHIDWPTIWMGVLLTPVVVLTLALIFAQPFEEWLEHLDYMKHHPHERRGKK